MKGLNKHRTIIRTGETRCIYNNKASNYSEYVFVVTVHETAHPGTMRQSVDCKLAELIE